MRPPSAVDQLFVRYHTPWRAPSDGFARLLYGLAALTGATLVFSASVHHGFCWTYILGGVAWAGLTWFFSTLFASLD